MAVRGMKDAYKPSIIVSSYSELLPYVCIRSFPRSYRPLCWTAAQGGSSVSLTKATLLFAGLSGKASLANTWKPPLQGEVAAVVEIRLRVSTLIDYVSFIDTGEPLDDHKQNMHK